MSSSIRDEIKYGTGIKFENGDIAIDDAGHFVIVDGRERTAEAIQILLLTQKNEDLIHPETGFDYLELVKNSSDLTNVEQIDLAKLLIRQAVLQDDRVKEISDIIYNEDDSDLTIRLRAFDVIITLFNEEELSLQLKVEI